MRLGARQRKRHLSTKASHLQPGSLAALHEDVVAMGFRPLVYASQKGFLNHTPERREMRHWARKQGISETATIAFTDGTKVQIEQALVANGLGAGIARAGLIGPSNSR